MKEPNQNLMAICAVLLSAVIIGFSFPVVKTGLLYSSPLLILMDRIFIGLLMIILLKKSNIISIEKVPLKQKRALFALSALYPIVFFLLQNISIKKITVSEASILFALVPILTTIATAIILKEKTSIFQKIGIALSFCGMLYISLQSFDGISDSKSGYLIMLGSIISLVLYLVSMRKYVTNLSSFTITYYLLSYAAIISIPLYLVSTVMNFEQVLDFSRFTNINYILVILYLGILSTFITSLLTAYGVKKLSTVQTAILNNVSPIFGVIAGVAIMGDVLETYQIIGGLMVFAGMFLSLKFKK